MKGMLPLGVYSLKTMKTITYFLLAILIVTSCKHSLQPNTTMKPSNKEITFSIQKSENEWKASLSPEQFQVLRKKGTERPFTGEYNVHFENGVYSCAACSAPLFKSENKFDSHCGWPSFDRALDSNTVVEILDKSHNMIRTEIVCANCGGHLGHVFNDGPTETGMRYCINSVSLQFDSDTTNTPMQP